MTDHSDYRANLGAAPTANADSLPPAPITPTALTGAERFTHPRDSDEFERLLTFGIDEVRDWLHTHSSPDEILPNLLELAPVMHPKEWLAVLGEFWGGFSRIGPLHEALTSVVSNFAINPQSAISEMMEDSEHAELEVLPDLITIYRGCGPVNKSGCSWTLDRWIAERVPFIEEYRAERPLLLTATLPRHRIAALKLGRVGREVIVFSLSENEWTEEELTDQIEASA